VKRVGLHGQAQHLRRERGKRETENKNGKRKESGNLFEQQYFARRTSFPLTLRAPFQKIDGALCMEQSCTVKTQVP